MKQEWLDRKQDGYNIVAIDGQFAAMKNGVQFPVKFDTRMAARDAIVCGLFDRRKKNRMWKSEEV